MATAATIDPHHVLLARPEHEHQLAIDVASRAGSATPCSARRGEQIVSAGESHHHLFLVIDGVAEAVDADGRHRWLLAPATFGDQAFLDGSVETETVTATSDMNLIRYCRRQDETATADTVTAGNATDSARNTAVTDAADVAVMAIQSDNSGASPRTPTLPSPRSRLALLFAQSFAGGVVLASVAIAGSAVFLERYGSGLLPVVYLAVAIVGAGLGLGLQRLRRRYRLTTLAIANPVVVAATVALGWALIVGASASWASFGLLMLFRLQLQVGFVLVGGQAGRLFDVQQIKRFHPKIVGGLATGFLVAGLVTGPVIALSGRAEHVLLVAVAAASLHAGFAWLTARRFGRQLQVGDRGGIHGGPSAEVTDEASSMSLRQLLSRPYVGFLFSFQVLCAVGSQLVDYLFYERAAARYTSSLELAGFLGPYTAALNLVDIVFLVVVAGALLARFGVRYGLLANSTAVTLLLAAAVVVAGFAGLGSAPLFFLLAGARIVDLALNNGATLSSINAAYQPLPVAERLRAQIGVEGVGVPVAIGATGLVLLLVNALPVDAVTVLLYLTTAVGIIWMATGVVVYRHYRRALVVRLCDGAGLVGPEQLSAADPTDQLITSPDPSLAAQGLDRLEARADPAYGLRVVELASAPRTAVRAMAIDRLGGLRSPTVEETVTRALVDVSPTVRAAAVRARSRTGEVTARACAQWRDDPDRGVRATAAAVTLRLDDPKLRCLAQAQLVDLLMPSDGQVQRGVVNALAGDGDLLLPFLELTFLGSATTTVPAMARARVIALESVLAPMRFEDPTRAESTLLPHLGAIHPRLATAVVRALVASDHRPSAAGRRLLVEMLDHELRVGRVLLSGLNGLPLASAAAQPSCPSASNELQTFVRQELALLGPRVLAVLALLHDSDVVERSFARLRAEEGPKAALAAEALDVVIGQDLRKRVTAILGTETGLQSDEAHRPTGAPPRGDGLIEALLPLAASGRLDDLEWFERLVAQRSPGAR